MLLHFILLEMLWLMSDYEFGTRAGICFCYFGLPLLAVIINMHMEQVLYAPKAPHEPMRTEENDDYGDIVYPQYPLSESIDK